MAIDHRRFSPILRGPVISNWQSELVGFARGFAVEAKLPNRTRTAAMHFLPQAGVRDDQPATVENVVADESIQKRREFRAILGRHGLNLSNRQLQAVLHLNLLAAQPSGELYIVVAGDAKSRSGGDHVPDDAHRIDHLRSTIHQIAQKDRAAARRVSPTLVAPRRLWRFQGVADPAELLQEQPQLIGATMQVAKYIEGPNLLFLVVPQRSPADLDFFIALHDVNVAEALPLQAPKPPFEFGDLAADHVWTERTIGPAGIALQTHPLGRIQHDRHRKAVVSAGVLHQALPILRAYVGGINNGEPSPCQPLAEHVVQRVES